MKKRDFLKYQSLFEKYNELDERQEELFDGKIFIPEEKKDEWEEKQIKKIAISEEMEKCFC